MAIPLTPESERFIAEIEQGWQSARRGEFVEGDDVFDRIDAELETRERARSYLPPSASD